MYSDVLTPIAAKPSKYDDVYNNFALAFSQEAGSKDWGSFMLSLAVIEAACIISTAIDHLTESVYANNI